MAERVERETVTDFDQTGWSTWRKMMVPTADGAGQDFKARPGDLPGYRLPPQEVMKKLGDDGDMCGTYEWRARRNQEGAQGRVVYVGSTCRGKRGSLSARINEYCQNGSHKNEEINGALENNYELWVHVKTCSQKITAENRENQLLAMYDYAWNIRNNGHMRDIL